MKEFPFSPAPLRKIKAVQFGILSPDEISAMSVCKIESPETNEIGQPNVPKKGGLNDPSLGTTDRSGKCTTCESNYLDCPGHFGHIQLNKPVFQVGFMTKTLKVLRCICDQCGKLLVSRLHSKFHEATRSRNPRTRLRKVMDLCKSVSTCQPDDPENPDPKRGCGAVQHKYMKKGLSITKQDRAAKRIAEEVQYITPEEVYHIFKLMTDDDIKALGFNPIHARPEWMLTTMLPVCPPTVRPSIQQDGMPGGQDDLTYILVNIIKANDNLGRNERDGAAPHIITDYYQLLQYLVATYVDNEIPGLPRHKHKTGRPFKSIRARLKGKEGRIRGNLMGKRVDFSARTVIGPDPNLWLDQVGVPRSIALNLTYPEVVTPLNIQRLEALVRNGPNEHPGAKYVIRDNGERIDLRFNRRDVHLQPGYQVERHLADDDIVLFNRQPSLHKMSMMGHRVKVMPYSTFRLNLSVTTPYNADFDGDEMNLHVPQTIEARVELLELALVPTQIVSPQSNRPVMGIVQDSLNGINKFTRRDVFLDKAAVMQLLMWVSDWDGIIPVPAIIKPKPLWTGKQMVSLIIPDVNIVRKHATHDDKIPNADFSVFDTNVLIERGELLTGMVCKKTVGQSGGSLIHVIWNQHGPKAAASFFTNCQFLVNNWMLMNGFSVGIGDCIANPNTMIKIERIINDSKKSVEGLIEKAQTGEFDREPGMTLRESVESRINKELSDTRNKAGTEAMKSLKPDNNFKQMINAGSKGSELNISQIAACVGQQNVEGKRIPFAFRRRTLPHFQKDSYGPESRGFVENSYLRGLMPQEFFFHAMGGREGLIDTAVKTSETGYIQRRLVKAMEDLIARYDGTVRNSVGEIIQFLYGEDGLNAIMVEEQTLDLLTLNDDDFIKKYRIDMDISNTRHIFLERNNIVNASIAQAVSSEPLEVQKALEEEFRQLQHDRKTLQDKMYLKLNGNRCFLPVNIRRFIWNAQNLFSVDRRKPSDLNPINIVNKVQMLCKQLVAVPGADKLSQEAQQNATLLLQILIRSTLSVKTVLLEHHLDEKAFDWLLGEIETTFLKALVHPGETVGTIAAQSIGEPATQMTLRTFHFAGVGAKNVTLGVPRLRELINVAKKIKTPQLTIYLKSLAANNTDIAQAVKARIEHASLRDVSAISEIYFDADIKNSVVLEDREFVKDWLESEYIDGEVPYFSPWMLRLELDRKMMLDHRLSTIDVSRKIEGKFGSIEFEQTGQETNTSMPIKCIYSDDNADKLIIRVHLIDSTRMYGDEEKDPGHATEGNEKLLKEFENQLMAEISLAGIKEITQVKIDDEDVLKIGTDGKDKGKLIHVKENVLRTSGVNLLAVLSHEDIDAVRTVSNDIVETIEVLGIEAARQSLMTELKRVIEFDGSYVNNRHLSCLCDVMTYKGYLMAITRHGINRNDTGPLMRCSFEETVEILVEAAAFAELDEMRGVSENIMLGQMGPFGTGEFDVLLAEDMLSDAIVDPNAPVSMGYFPGAQTPGMPTPMMGSRSPLYHQQYSPSQTPLNAQFSPSLSGSLPGQWSPMGSRTGYSPSSPSYSPSSPSYSPSSPSYSPSSPSYSPSSPSYSPSSPSYSPTSPKYSATSPRYSPTSPSHLGSAASPNYSPSSPAHISPTSPSYSPTSPKYTAASPSYSPSSPSYSMTSPAYSPTSPSYSMTSPAYSPTSPSYNQPRYGTTSPNYSPTSPSYQAGLSPTSPSYSPSSPSYSPTSPSYNAQISPTSPSYSPTSPSYSPVGGMYRTPQPPTSS